MSLNRASSRKKFSITPEDLSPCLDQKNSMIAVLQAEVEDLRINHEKYERMREEVHRTRERYESLIREYVNQFLILSKSPKSAITKGLS